MATLEILDQTLARLQAAAAARHVSLQTYLDEMAEAEGKWASSPAVLTQFRKSTLAQRAAAAASIQKLAAEVNGKAAIEELAADKHTGHKY